MIKNRSCISHIHRTEHSDRNTFNVKYGNYIEIIFPHIQYGKFFFLSRLRSSYNNIQYTHFTWENIHPTNLILLNACYLENEIC